MTSVTRQWQAAEAAIAAALRLVDGRVEGTLDRGAGPVATEATVERLDAHRVRLRRGDRVVVATVLREHDLTWVALEGRTYEIRERDPEAAEEGTGGPLHATSPMTGTVIRLGVAPGDAVASGGELFIVEAMKMEYVVRAPRDVRIAAVHTAVGASVDLGERIVDFAPEDDA